MEVNACTNAAGALGNHLDEWLGDMRVDVQHPAYEMLEQAFNVFLGNIEPAKGKPPRFWLISSSEPSHSAYGEGWTDEELSATVSAYLQMLALEQGDKPYVKKEFNEALRAGALKSRTASSVEYRMQNISAVLEELCLPRIVGYKPAKNLGDNAKERIKRLLAEQQFISLELYEPTPDPVEQDNRTVALRRKFVSGTPKGNKAPQRSSTVREAFARDALVIAWVLETAEDTCECCGEKAPFTRADGTPYLEVHHVRTLADGGSDQISNAVAICPNCHRHLHLGGERDQLKASLYAKVKRLVFE